MMRFGPLSLRHHGYLRDRYRLPDKYAALCELDLNSRSSELVLDVRESSDGEGHLAAPTN